MLNKNTKKMLDSMIRRGRQTVAVISRGVSAGMHWKGGGPHPPLQAPSLCPAGDCAVIS